MQMAPSRSRQSSVGSDSSVLGLIALSLVVLHLFTNGQYGFHRDELQTLDDARHLAWGYVAYPPATPFIEHVAWSLFWAFPGWPPPLLCARARCRGCLNRLDGP